MPKELLKDLGLKDNETSLYLALLKEGPSSVQRISKLTGIERSMCYQVINQLRQRQMISSEIRDNKRYYRAADPDSLFNLLKSREDEINILRDRLSEKLPDFTSFLNQASSPEFKVDIYTGREGCKNARMKVLNESKEIFTIGYTKYRSLLLDHWKDYWCRERIKRKIFNKVIVSPAFKGAEGLRQPFTQARILPSEHRDDSPTSTMIFGGDKVLISLFTPEEYFGIMITSRQVHNSYKNYFSIMWDASEELKD